MEWYLYSMGTWWPWKSKSPQGLTKEVAYFCWFFLTCLFQRSLHFHSLAPILCTWAIKKTLILFHQLVDEYPHYGFWSSSVNGFKESWIPALPRGWDSTQQKLGPTGGWNVELSICPSVYPSIYILLFSLLIYLPVNLSISVSFPPSA